MAGGVLELACLDAADLNAAEAFNRDVYAANSMAFDPVFFAWQFDRCGGVGHGADNGAWVVRRGDAIVATCLVARLPMVVEGAARRGGFFHHWFAKPDLGSPGLAVLRKATAGLDFVGGARITLLAVSTLKAFFRPFPWFETPRLFAVMDAERAAALSFGEGDCAVRFLAACRVREAVSGVSVSTIERFGDEHDVLWHRLRGGFLAAAERDARFMNWRYVDHPYLRYARIRCDGPAGPAVYVWRDELLPDGETVVCRMCEALGEPEALRLTFAAAWRAMNHPGVAFVDFFCSNAVINAALTAGGMTPAVTRPDFDLATRLRPVEAYASKTLDFYYGFPSGGVPPAWAEHPRTYFTRGDSNQDIPLRDPATGAVS